MSSKILLEVVTPTEDVTHIEVNVSYDKGGPNYFSGGHTKRGVHVAVCPVRIKDGMCSFTLFSGRGKFLLAMDRLNRKKVDECVQQVRDQIESQTGDIWELVQAICQKFKVEVKPLAVGV